MRTVKPWSRVVVASSLIVLAVATWVLLGRLRPRAEWVQVRGPRYVLVARPLELQLTLSGLERPAWLTVDLHRVEAPDGPGRFLMTVGSMRVGPGSGRAGRSAGTSAFAFQVPPLDDLRWVFAVVYLSQTGS
jgi:hypothetical protein